MTAKEAIESIQVEGLEITGKLSRVNEFIQGLVVAEEALRKQSKLTNVIGRIEELANAFQEDKQYEVHCKDRCEGCSYKDCCTCTLERAIEIIKEELM